MQKEEAFQWHPEYEKSRVNFSEKEIHDARLNWIRGVMYHPSTDLNADARRLAFFLMDKFFNWKTGQCNPAVKTLAELVGKTPRAVQGMLRTLADAGLISVVPRKSPDNPKLNLSNQYRLLGINLTKRKVPARDADNDNHPVKNSSGGGEESFRRVAQDSSGGVVKHSSPEPHYLEPHEKNQERNAREAFGDDWPPDAFDQFYRAYPHKVDKQRAREALEHQRKQGASFAAIMAGVVVYRSTKPQGQQWLNPATFLNRKRWEDEAASPEAGTKPKSKNRLAI